MRRARLSLSGRRVSAVFVLALTVAAIRSCVAVTPQTCRLEAEHEQHLRVGQVSRHPRTKTTIGAAIKCPVR